MCRSFIFRDSFKLAVRSRGAISAEILLLTSPELISTVIILDHRINDPWSEEECTLISQRDFAVVAEANSTNYFVVIDGNFEIGRDMSISLFASWSILGKILITPSLSKPPDGEIRSQ